MKFHLLVAASALVVGLGMSGAAFAGGNDNHGNDHGKNNDPTTSASAAVALNQQNGASLFSFAKGTDGSNTIGTVNGTGLVNIQQNNGANSVLQDQNTLGAILNCSCSSSTSTNAFDLSLAASQQNALVLGDVSIGATNKTASGSGSSAWNNTKNGTASTSGTVAIGTKASAHGDDADASAATGNSSASDNDNHVGNETHTWAFASTAVQSSNNLSSFGGTGLYNISQNNGNNSVLQSGNTVAAIVGK